MGHSNIVIFRSFFALVILAQIDEKETIMDEAAFWTLVQETRLMSNGAMDTQLELMIQHLVELTPDEILECEQIILELVRLSYRADLWDACEIMTCEPSESAFAEFQGWLIAQGQAIYEDALENPETLATAINIRNREDIGDGRLRDVASDAYYQKLAEDIPLVSYSQHVVLLGEHAVREDFPTRYPMLFAKFGNCDDE
jgi:hypothetical protein